MQARRRSHPARLAVAVSLVAAAFCRPAFANGDNSHLWITSEAIAELPEGSLKDMLGDPELLEIVLNGSIFPDGGYVIEDGYGEMAHWEPFIEAYRAWIANHFDKPYTDGEAARHVAFLLGIAAHDMADWVFDSQFMEMARVYDSEGWADGLIDGFDTATDVLLVADTGVALQPESWVPADELSQLYVDAFGYEVDAATLWTGQDMLHRIVLSYPRETGLNEPDKVQDYREQYPWAAANHLDPLVPGSPPTEALVVTAYWQSMWFRLHGEAGPDLVVATTPGNGAHGHPTDHTLVESQVVVVFGNGMDESTITPDSVTVTGTDGVPHPVELSLWGGDDGNLLRIRPTTDWEVDTDYTVTLTPGVSTRTGVSLGASFSFTFSTAAVDGAPVPPCTDPTPFEGEPDLGEASGGGCAIARTPLGEKPRTWPWVLLVLSALAFAARRRTRPIG